MQKQELLDTIQHEAQEWEHFLDEVGEGRMEQPGATGEWTFKDVVAHLSAWRSRSLSYLEAVRNDQTPSSQFWPAGWDEEDEEELEKINQWIYEENHDRSLHDILNESRQQFRHMRELMRAIPEDKLFDPNRFDWLDGGTLADLVKFNHFHKEHEPELRSWLASQPATVQDNEV